MANNDKKQDEKLGEFAFRSDTNYGRWAEMTYGGALSFLRRRYDRCLDDVDVAVLGIPFDQTTTYRSGARLGPRAIRAASVQLAELKAFPFGFDPFDHLNVIDWGDVFLDSGYPDSMVDEVVANVTPFYNQGVKPLAMGGDHFVTYPLLKAAAVHHGPIALVHFDAHSDCWPDDGKRLDHGTMFTRAVKQGIIQPEHSIQLGLRTWVDEPLGFQQYDAPTLHATPLKDVIDHILKIVGDRPAYLTFDVDFLDPAFAPGTGTPVVGGFSTHQALTLLRGLGALNWVGGDVVEVAPAYDVSEITALAAATVMHDFLCLLSQKKQLLGG